MKGKLKYRGILLFLLLCISTIHADITGFVSTGYQKVQNESGTFYMGPMEIDFETEYANAAFEGAVVVENGEVSLGQTMIDLTLKGEMFGLQIGLMDMPFGLDYEVYATPDRKLISTPLTTELMLDGGWSDIGINLHGDFKWFNYNLYAVNGFGEDSGAPVNQLFDNNSGKTFGGRLEFSPVEGLRVGVSYAEGPYLNDDDEHKMKRTGAHLSFEMGRVWLKGEYVMGSESDTAGEESKHYGYYAQALGYITSNIYGVVRYGEWKPENGDKVSRLSLGLGYELCEDVRFNVEYQINSETPEVDNNVIITQVVISFH